MLKLDVLMTVVRNHKPNPNEDKLFKTGKPISMNNPTRYNSLLDWSTWLLVGSVEVVCLLPLLLDDDGSMMIPVILVAVAFFVFMLILFKGTYFEISDRNLIVYEFFRPTVLPIDKIESVTRVKTILACSATSLTNRLAIKFSDRKVLKSSMPLIISPVRQTDFINQLIKINPNIIADYPIKNIKNKES